jgi:hypothetical protein
MRQWIATFLQLVALGLVAGLAFTFDMRAGFLVLAVILGAVGLILERR